MPERKSFLLRIDRDTLDAVQRWANDDLRSLNGQIEFLLRRALQANARAPKPGVSRDTTDDADDASSADAADESDDSNSTN